MTLLQFVRVYRHEIDDIIKEINPNQEKFNDEERISWVMNDEGLYNWAKAYKVKL